MNNPLFLLSVLFSEAKKSNFILKTIILSALYLSTSIILINFRTLLNFLLNDYPLFAKIKILFLLFIGTFSAISRQDLIFLVLISLLFGLNLELILRKLKFLARTGNLQLTFGVGIITVFTAGCASCGLSIASLAGLTGVLVLLPYHGTELYIFSIFILAISLLYNLNTLVKVCKIE